MKKNKKNLSILKRIGLIAVALFTAFGSLFIPLRSINHNVTYADYSATNVTFVGSNIYLPVMRLNNGSTNSFVADEFLFATSFEQNYVTSTFTFDFSRSSGFGFVDLYDWYGKPHNVAYFGDVYIDRSPQADNSYSNQLVFNNIYPSIGYSDSLHFLHYKFQDTWYTSVCLISFTPNLDKIVGCEIGSLDVNSSNIGGSAPSDFGYFGKYNFISYFDSNGSKVTLKFLTINLDSDYVLSNRIYYFDTDFTDNEFYNQGYLAGLSDNQQPIYDGGFLAGKTVGESIGYEKGVREANNYSFVSLFGAVIDAPIKAFSGLFKFEFLGINLLDFFLGLLTFGVIIFVIKLLLGGK